MKQQKVIYNLMLIFFFSLVVSSAISPKDLSAEENPLPPNADKTISNNEVLIVEVNGNKLTQKELDADINTKLETIKNRFPKERLDQVKTQMRKKLIDNFISRTVINQEAEKQNITVSDAEVNSKINEIAKNIPDGMSLEDAIKMNGMTMEALREDIKFGLISNKLFDSQAKNDASPSEEAIKKYYTDNKKQFDEPETVHARHILIKTKDSNDEKIKAEKKTKIEALRKKLVDGAEFEKIATENSDCPSKTKGGDLGTFSRGRMVKQFEEAAFSQKTDEIGPVVETRFGYHIIQVLEHNKAQSKSLEDVKKTIIAKISQQQKNTALNKYVENLKEKASIVFGSSENL